MEGKPVTAFLVTALILYAIWLWRQGRLGHIGGGAVVPSPKFISPPVPAEMGRWQVGTPPIASPTSPEEMRQSYPAVSPQFPASGDPSVFGG
jgi:hypothetical protein